jgi:hypothetical protein
MSKLFGRMGAEEKPREVKITSNERIHIELYKGNAKRVDVSFDGDIVEVNGMMIELEE